MGVSPSEWKLEEGENRGILSRMRTHAPISPCCYCGDGKESLTKKKLVHPSVSGEKKTFLQLDAQRGRSACSTQHPGHPK